MKKFMALLLTLSMALACLSFTACGKKDSTKYDLKIGAIMVGDRTEGYTAAHMDGIDAAVAALEAEGKKVKVTYNLTVGEDDTLTTKARSLAAAGNNIVITNSYGHQFYIADVVAEFPDVTFVSMTGDLAAGSGLSNWKNAFTNVYESRYVSGIVAGMKIKELVEADPCPLTSANYTSDGKVKVGYVGAYSYAEVVSGYTAFYLGIKSVYENVAMQVTYTGSWFSIEDEANTADSLIANGCVIIGQHADSTGAPTKCQTKLTNGTVCYSVGYNVDMLEAAPTAALTSATNNWKVYYEYLFRQVLNGEEVATDWAKGYSQNAVAITDLGPSCAAGTAEAVATAIAAIKAGTLKVFDTSTFTVGGNPVETYEINGLGNAIATEDGKTFFNESVLRSAPYFDLRIDGITENNTKF